MTAVISLCFFPRGTLDEQGGSAPLPSIKGAVKRLYAKGEKMAHKDRQDRERLNTEVFDISLTPEKLTGEQLLDLARFCVKYPPLTSDLEVTDMKILTIKQFCLHLAREMSYHRELDKIEFS